MPKIKKSRSPKPSASSSSSASKTVDMVNHPPHYNKGQFETLDVIEDIVQFYDGTDAWSVGNVLRYLSRAPHKGFFLEDLKKAQFYMNNLIKGHTN